MSFFKRCAYHQDSEDRNLWVCSVLLPIWKARLHEILMWAANCGWLITLYGCAGWSESLLVKHYFWDAAHVIHEITVFDSVINIESLTDGHWHHSQWYHCSWSYSEIVSTDMWLCFCVFIHFIMFECNNSDNERYYQTHRQKRKSAPIKQAPVSS